MKLIVLLLSAFLVTKCYSQHLLHSPEPDWMKTASQIIKSQNFKTDSVYLYKKKKNNKDSLLIATQHFDSLGNLVERDEYSDKREVIEISNYTYMDEMLMREETISRKPYSVNGSSLSKEIKTYDYNSLGNVVAEKKYTYYGESPEPTIEIWNRDYDSMGHLIKEYLTPPKGKSFLYHAFFYSDGILTEMKSFDYNENWIYSYLYEFDTTTSVKSIYLFNSMKKLSQELFFDSQKRLIMEKYYEGVIPFYTDHTTRKYFYNSSGIEESQSYQDMRGENHYYKHFYSK